MTQQSEWNKMIAVFMQDEIAIRCAESDQELEYHTSWDWLMPVVEKICKLKDGFMFDFNICVDLTEVIISEEVTAPNEPGRDFERVCDSVTINNPLQAVYQAVVKFITYYNSINKTT